MVIGKYKGGLKSSISGFKNTKSELPLPNTENAIIDFLFQEVEKLKTSLDKKDNVASGTLKDGIDLTDISFDGNKYKIAIKYEDYGVEVDEGRKPQGYSKENMAKLQPKIYLWIQNKESLHSIAGEKKRQLSLSYVFARSILRKGTKGSGWLSDVIGKNSEILSKDLSQVVSNMLGRDVEVLVTKQAQMMLDGNHSK